MGARLGVMHFSAHNYAPYCDYPGDELVIFGILGSVFVVTALVLATVAGYSVSFFAGHRAHDAQTFSLEINGCKWYKQPKAVLRILRLRINMVLRDCSSSVYV